MTYHRQLESEGGGAMCEMSNYYGEPQIGGESNGPSGPTTTVWVTRDGRQIPVVETSDAHLVNTIRYLRRTAAQQLMEATLKIAGTNDDIEVPDNVWWEDDNPPEEVVCICADVPCNAGRSRETRTTSMTTPNFDTMLDRLRERQTERDDDATICDNCRAGLTETDREMGFCAQCKSSIESDDEDLTDDAYD